MNAIQVFEHSMISRDINYLDTLTTPQITSYGRCGVHGLYKYANTVDFAEYLINRGLPASTYYLVNNAIADCNEELLRLAERYNVDKKTEYRADSIESFMFAEKHGYNARPYPTTLEFDTYIMNNRPHLHNRELEHLINIGHDAETIKSLNPEIALDRLSVYVNCAKRRGDQAIKDYVNAVIVDYVNTLTC